MRLTVPRALVDTNVFVSYLLSGRHATGSVTDVMTGLERNRFMLLLPDELLSELTDVFTTRR